MEASGKMEKESSPSIKKQSLGQWTGNLKHNAKRANPKGMALRKEPGRKFENKMMALMEQGMKLQQSYSHLQNREV